MATVSHGLPPTTAQLLEQAGTAQLWWGMIAAFLADEYRAKKTVRWLSDLQAWGQTCVTGSAVLVHIVPGADIVKVFIPFSVSAIKRGIANASLLDGPARDSFNDYLAEADTMPTVRVASESDVDTVIRLVSLAHPRKGHPCGSV